MASAAFRVLGWIRQAARRSAVATRAALVARPRPRPGAFPGLDAAEARSRTPRPLKPDRGLPAHAVRPDTATDASARAPRGGGGRVRLPLERVLQIARSIGLPEDRRSLGVYRACLLLPGPESRRFCVLGDSVLYLLATEAQFDAGVTPSGMHTARACVITNKHLAVRGRAMGLPSLIAPAVGEPGEKRIADSVEALIGAVWFLHGRAAAEKFVCDWIMRRDAPPGSAGDPA